MPASRSALISLITANSPRVAVAVNQPLVHFLVTARELCGGDLDTMLVLMVVIQRANLHPEFHALDPDAMEEVGELPSFELNIQSIADSTSIPKETVRRKVDWLVKRGWVEREGRSLRYSAEGYRALGRAREALVRMAAGIVHAVNALPPLAAETDPASEARRSQGAA